jgi:Phosphotransferase enzyme family
MRSSSFSVVVLLVLAGTGVALGGIVASDWLPVESHVLSRWGFQRLARHWRLLSYRDPPRSAPVGRVEQVEHEALATLMAARVGVRVPEVVTAALGPEGNALVVTCQPDVEPLERFSPDQISDDTLLELWEQVHRLHAAGISHGRLNLGNVLLTEKGPMLVDWAAATLGAPQSAPLTSATSRGKASSGSKALRRKVAETTGQDVPEVVPLRRFRLKDVALGRHSVSPPT